MLPLHDAHVRLVLLSHIAVQGNAGDPEILRAAGIENELLEHLRRLSAPDLHRLAAMREPMFAVSVDADRLKAGLRALALTNEAKAQETYFIRHGASWSMMKKLFKVRHKLTLQRRRELGVRRLPGRLTLPRAATRERIWRFWNAMTDTDPRTRYYQLHQAFRDFSLEALETVVCEFEKDRYVGPANPAPRSPPWQRESEQHAKWRPQTRSLQPTRQL